MKPRFLVYGLMFLALLSVKATAQQIEFSEPVRLNSTINSEGEELMPLLTPDGSKLYFTRAFHPENVGGAYAGMDIWVSGLDEANQWDTPANALGPLNNKDNNSIIGLKADNKVVYLINTYAGKKGLAFSKRIGEGWSKPEKIPIAGFKKDGFSGFYMNPSYNVLLISMESKDSFGQEDIYVSIKDSTGVWQEPVNLGPVINTRGFETSPFLSADGKILYFSSDGHPGLGDADIFMSERLYDSWTIWTKPKNLGKQVNSEAFDSYFSMYGDSVCFFSSNRGGGSSDIYTSTLEIKRRSILQDSIDKIVQEAEVLLADISNDVDMADPESKLISFSSRNAEVSLRAKKSLNKIVEKIVGGSIKVSMICYSDEYFDVSLNNELSERRAQSVKNYLVEQGIDGSKVSYRVTSNSDEMPRNKSGVLINVLK